MINGLQKVCKTKNTVWYTLSILKLTFATDNLLHNQAASAYFDRQRSQKALMIRNDALL